VGEAVRRHQLAAASSTVSRSSSADVTVTWYGRRSRS
jgi:hypothetical protein